MWFGLFLNFKEQVFCIGSIYISMELLNQTDDLWIYLKLFHSLIIILQSDKERPDIASCLLVLSRTTSTLYPCKHLLWSWLWDQILDCVVVWEPGSWLLHCNSARQLWSDHNLPGHKWGVLQCGGRCMWTDIPHLCGLLRWLLWKPTHIWS